MTAFKLLGRILNLKQSTWTKPEISPNLSVLLQRTEYFIALLTIPIVIELDISVPMRLSLKRPWLSKNDFVNRTNGKTIKNMTSIPAELPALSCR